MFCRYCGKWIWFRAHHRPDGFCSSADGRLRGKLRRGSHLAGFKLKPADPVQSAASPVLTLQLREHATCLPGVWCLSTVSKRGLLFCECFREPESLTGIEEPEWLRPQVLAAPTFGHIRLAVPVDMSWRPHGQANLRGTGVGFALIDSEFAYAIKAFVHDANPITEADRPGDVFLPGVLRGSFPAFSPIPGLRRSERLELPALQPAESSNGPRGLTQVLPLKIAYTAEPLPALIDKHPDSVLKRRVELTSTGAAILRLQPIAPCAAEIYDPPPRHGFGLSLQADELREASNRVPSSGRDPAPSFVGFRASAAVRPAPPGTIAAAQVRFLLRSPSLCLIQASASFGLSENLRRPQNDRRARSHRPSAGAAFRPTFPHASAGRLPDIVRDPALDAGVPVAFGRYRAAKNRAETPELLLVPARQIGRPSAPIDYRSLISESQSVTRALPFSMQPELIWTGVIAGAGLRKAGAATIAIRHTADSPAFLLFGSRLNGVRIPPLARSNLRQAAFTPGAAPSLLVPSKIFARSMYSARQLWRAIVPHVCLVCPFPRQVRLVPALARFAASASRQPVRDSLLAGCRERLLHAGPLPFSKSRLPRERLQCTTLALRSSDDAAPLGLRWQRKKELWDRGARWKRPTATGSFLFCNLALCHHTPD